MRVFYEENENENEKEKENINKEKRRYYVKIDNIIVPEDLKGYKVIEASSVSELIENIKEYYKLKDRVECIIQLWSGNKYKGQRLDVLSIIPEGVEFIWVRGVTNKIETI
jgi:hypothetical protein